MANLIRGLDDDALAEREARVEVATRAALARVMRKVTRGLGEVVTAAGDPGAISPDDLGAIVPLWHAEVEGTLVPMTAEVYRDSGEVVRARLIEASDGPVPRVSSLASQAHLATITETYDLVGPRLWEDAREQLLEGMAAGEGIPELSHRLRVVAPELASRDAVMLARTTVLDASNAGSYDTALASGLPLLKGWDSTPDLRTRPTHVSAGATYAGAQMIAMDALFIVGGFSGLRPHDVSFPAEERANCRCTIVYRMPDDAPDDDGGAAARLRAAHDARLAALEAARAKRLAAIDEGVAEQLREQESRVAAQLAAERARVDAVTAEMRAQQARAIEAMTAEQERVAARLAAEQARVARIEAGFAKRREALEMERARAMLAQRELGETGPVIPDRVARSVKSRTQRPEGYPTRYPVPDDKASWDVPFDDYDPPDYTAQVVLDNDRTVKPGGWADPADIRLVDRPLLSSEGPVTLDADGHPRNPYTRTGIRGRGLLGRWGANQAADPIITRVNPATGRVEALLIRRAGKVDGREQWAIPGGMVDEGERVSATLGREFLEETGFDLDMTEARIIYRGYVDDPRNTDQAWMETTAAHRHLTGDLARRADFTPQPGEVTAVEWREITPELLDDMYASHADLLRTAVRTGNLDDALPMAAPPGPMTGLAPAATRVTSVPVRASLMEARTVAEVRQVFLDEWDEIIRSREGLRLGHGANFAGDVQTAREHAEGLLRSIERFPRAPLTRVSTRQLAAARYAQVDRGETITLGRAWADDRDEYLISLRIAGRHDAQGVAWHPISTASPQGVATHEFGHVLHHGLDHVAIRREVQAIARAMADELGIDADELARLEIGQYAAGSTDELIADAFADAMINGDAASALSQRIFAVLVREYDALEGDAGRGAAGASETLARAARPANGQSFEARLSQSMSGDEAFETVPVRVGAEATSPGAMAVRSYSGGRYGVINRVLRGTQSQVDDVAAASRAIADIDSLMDRSPLSVDTALYRGVQTREDRFGFRAYGSRSLVGVEWLDPAYSSTSAFESLARDFATKEPWRQTDRYLMRILAPKGTKALVDVGPLDEREILLQRGLRFRVVADNGIDARGVRLLDVEIIPSTEAAPEFTALGRSIAEALALIDSGGDVAGVAELLAGRGVPKALAVARRARDPRRLAASLRALAEREGAALPTKAQLRSLAAAEARAAREAKRAEALAARAEKARAAEVKRQAAAVRRGDLASLARVEELTPGSAVYQDTSGARWLVEALDTERDARERALYAALHDATTRPTGAPALPIPVIGQGAPELRGSWQVAYPGLGAAPPGVGTADWLAVPLARLRALTPAKIKAMTAKAGLGPDVAERLIADRADAITREALMAQRFRSRAAPRLDDFAALSQATRAQAAKWVDGPYGSAGLRARLDDLSVGDFPDIGQGVRIEGRVVLGGQNAGEYVRYVVDDHGELVAKHDAFALNRAVQGSGFAEEFNANFIDWYRRSGVTRVELLANIDVGGYAWARAGYEFASQRGADQIAERLVLVARELRRAVRERRSGFGFAEGIKRDAVAEQLRAVESLLARIKAHPKFDDPLHPSAYEISQLGRVAGQGKDDMWAGKAAMLGSSWDAVLYL